jgi:hypothetical protein
MIETIGIGGRNGVNFLLDGFSRRRVIEEDARRCG